MELRLLLACDGKIEEQVLIRFSMKKEHGEKSERSRADKAERLECWERVRVRSRQHRDLTWLGSVDQWTADREQLKFKQKLL